MFRFLDVRIKSGGLTTPPWRQRKVVSTGDEFAKVVGHGLGSLTGIIHLFWQSITGGYFFVLNFVIY